MNALIFCAAILAADIQFDTPAPLFAPVTQATFFDADTLATSLRGQSPSTYYDEAPLGGAPGQPFAAPGQGMPYDPSLGMPPDLSGGLYMDQGLGFSTVGPQPYRFGWSSRFDVGFLPDAGVHGGGANGRFGVFEFNSAWRYTTGWPASFPNWIFSVTPEFDHRSWSGPSNPNLPANVFRFAGDFELATPGNNPLALQLGFTPAYVTDLQESPSSDSFNWDARGVVFWRLNPQWMLALGAAYWKRVDDIIIPYAGVVWTPNEYWEARLLFPVSRISYFLGNWWGAATWVYGGLEYHVEAYQIELRSPGGDHEKIQIADYRATFGLRAEGGGVTGFAEVGWVFNRDVKFLHGTPGFDINTGFIGRLGLRF